MPLGKNTVICLKLNNNFETDDEKKGWKAHYNKAKLILSVFLYSFFFSATVRKVCWKCENDETFSANHGKALEN